jgi:hypothetical protein
MFSFYHEADDVETLSICDFVQIAKNSGEGCLQMVLYKRNRQEVCNDQERGAGQENGNALS